MSSSKLCLISHMKNANRDTVSGSHTAHTARKWTCTLHWNDTHSLKFFWIFPRNLLIKKFVHEINYTISVFGFGHWFCPLVRNWYKFALYIKLNCFRILPVVFIEQIPKVWKHYNPHCYWQGTKKCIGVGATSTLLWLN